MSESDGLFTQTHERGHVRDQVSSRAWLQGMLDAEAALAQACAANGMFPIGAAQAIASACADAGRFDEAALAALAARTGNPVVGLVDAIRSAVSPEVADHVHCGATSQDIVDTAAMLVAGRAITELRRDLRACTARAAELAEQHRDTDMVARTLLQQAVPTTFGLKAAVWLHGIAAVDARLGLVQDTLPAQLGGAAGTLDKYPRDRAEHIVDSFAAQLGLAAAPLPWHTVRYPIADLAGVMATTAGILGKIALDLVLLSQTEVGELTWPDDGRGGSSTMSHKRNPVAAVAARSAAKRAPGLAATLFATMEQEHERAAGAWQAEWPTLSHLLLCVGSSAAWLLDALATLEVDSARMAANLLALGTDSSSESSAPLVDRVLADYRAGIEPANTDTTTLEGTD